MQDNIIECQNLTHYYGKRLIYENLSFQVPRGRILGLLGKNGTGKTTTINILSGYLQPHSGECRIFGENIRNMNPQTRQRMALLIEGHVQYTFMTIKEIERFYSAFFPAWNKDAYYELMHKLKVAPGQKISRMSCGQRSQVALGLILAQNAELLVLDDFSLGLDPGYRRLFIEYLKEYAKAESKTIFLTSHIIQDMERLIDDCIIMDYGKILIQKPVNDLLNTFTRYRFTTGSGEVQLPADSQLYNTSVIRGHAETYSFQDMEYVKQWLEQNGIPHTSLSAEKMNLEDVFIGLTGKYRIYEKSNFLQRMDQNTPLLSYRFNRIGHIHHLRPAWSTTSDQFQGSSPFMGNPVEQGCRFYRNFDLYPPIGRTLACHCPICTRNAAKTVKADSASSISSKPDANADADCRSE